MSSISKQSWPHARGGVCPEEGHAGRIAAPKNLHKVFASSIMAKCC